MPNNSFPNAGIDIDTTRLGCVNGQCAVVDTESTLHQKEFTTSECDPVTDSTLPESSPSIREYWKRTLEEGSSPVVASRSRGRPSNRAESPFRTAKSLERRGGRSSSRQRAMTSRTTRLNMSRDGVAVENREREISQSEESSDEESREDESKRHLRCLPHGIVWTILVVSFSWAGLSLSLLTRHGLNFVTLEEPWRISPMYEDVTSLGLVHASVCYNETISTYNDPLKVGCFKIALASNQNDGVFKAAAIFGSLSVFLGLFLTVSITTAVFWQTINLKAIGTGYLFVYCFQSLSFLFFDTDICEYYNCKVDIGAFYCILASIFWISCCLFCAKMDSNRVKAEIKEERKRRRRDAEEEVLKNHHSIIIRSGGASITEHTMSTISDNTIIDSDVEVAIPSRGYSTSGIERQHEDIINLTPSSRRHYEYSTTRRGRNRSQSLSRGRSRSQTLSTGRTGRPRSRGLSPTDSMGTKCRGISPAIAVRGTGTSRSPSRSRNQVDYQNPNPVRHRSRSHSTSRSVQASRRGRSIGRVGQAQTTGSNRSRSVTRHGQATERFRSNARDIQAPNDRILSLQVPPSKVKSARKKIQGSTPKGEVRSVRHQSQGNQTTTETDRSTLREGKHTGRPISRSASATPRRFFNDNEKFIRGASSLKARGYTGQSNSLVSRVPFKGANDVPVNCSRPKQQGRILLHSSGRTRHSGATASSIGGHQGHDAKSFYEL